MPGLYGVFHPDPQRAPDANATNVALDHMAASMQRGTRTETVPPVRVDGFAAGTVALSIMAEGCVASSADGRWFVAFDGEIYNLGELARTYTPVPPFDPAGGFGAAALRLVETCGFDWLAKADGVFALACYDARERRLHLASDRFGLNYLFVYQGAGLVVFGGELKAVLAHPAVPRDIDADAVAQAFVIGNVFGDKTWVKSVRLLPGRTHLTIDADGARERQCWAWSDIAAAPRGRTYRETVEEVARVFRTAVEKRSFGAGQGAFLSGGLDSRAIVAAWPKKADLTLVSLGIPGCADHLIAEKVARVRGATLHFFELGKPADWLARRVPWAVAADGFMNIFHCHAAESFDDVAGLMWHVHSGALGNSTFGGRHVIDPANVGPSLVKYEFRTPMTDRLGHVREMFAAEFHATDDSDAFYMEQRNHRCTIADTFWKHGFFLRYPIADNALQELVVGLGTEIRQSSALYRDMVLAAFPDFFQSIPWQKTGVPVGAPTWLAQLSRKSRYQAGRVVGLVNRWGLPVQSLRNYQNYAAWIREQPARRLVEGLLLDPKARYAHYTPPALVTRLVEEHMGRRKSHTDEIGMALTFEVMARWMDGTLDDDMARLAHD